MSLLGQLSHGMLAVEYEAFSVCQSLGVHLRQLFNGRTWPPVSPALPMADSFSGSGERNSITALALLIFESYPRDSVEGRSNTFGTFEKSTPGRPIEAMGLFVILSLVKNLFLSSTSSSSLLGTYS